MKKIAISMTPISGFARPSALCALLTSFLAAAMPSVTHADPAVGRVYGSMGFNDKVSAGPFEVQGMEGVDLVESPEATALKVGKGTHVLYRFDGEFPLGKGALEVRFKPDFNPEEATSEKTLFRVQGANFEWAFVYNPSGQRWMFKLSNAQKTWNEELVLWHGVVKPDTWNHVVLSWDRDLEPGGEFALYLDGLWKAKAAYSRVMQGPMTLEVGGEDPPEVLIDEISFYQRPVTEAQAAVMRETFASPEDRFACIEQKFLVDDEAVAQRIELVSKLEGHIGRLSHRKNSPTTDVKFPEGITAKAIRPQDIGKIDLSQFKVIYFPEGPRYELDPSQYEYIREYVKNGGGYVGSCQGAYLANDIKLLDFEAYPLNIWGIFAIIQEPSPINEWQQGQIHMHFGNGPVMLPGEGCQVVARYVMRYPGVKDHPAAIIMGEQGAGRVVLFGPHPLGGKVSRNGVKAYFSGKDLGTEKMLVDALLYAARITDFPQEAGD